MSDLPEPLVPADCDLRDLPGFMLNTERLLASELWALATGDEIKAALSLWCRAWKQVPAASLPDDRRIIAAFAGMSAEALFNRHQIVMRGFVKCSDGRWYHRTLAEDARRAWKAKQRRATDRATDSDRLKRWRERKNPSHETASETPDETASETRLKRVGQDIDRTKTGQEEKKESKRTPPSAPPLPLDASQAEPAPRPPEQTRLGSRLPENWQPGPELRQFAADFGLNADAVADQFRDYWHGVAGQKGRKADWPATWRNWCRRNDAEAKNGRKPPFTSRPGKLDWLRADLGLDVSSEFDGVTVEAAMGYQPPTGLPLSASTLAQECPPAVSEGVYSAPPLKSS